ncbi:GUN4 domain-containing protein, partial [Nostoc sp.]
MLSEANKKDREAAEQRNQLLSEANKKSKGRIRTGIVIFAVTVLGALGVGILLTNQVDNAKKKLNQTKEEVEAVQKLNKLAGELETKSKSSSEQISFDSNEALRLSALSFNIDNHELKEALVFAAMSQANQQLEKKLKEADEEIDQSQKFLAEADTKALDSNQGLQIQVFFHKIQGDLLVQNQQINKAKEAYTTAFNILKNHPQETNFSKQNHLLTSENIESLHRVLIKLVIQNEAEAELRKKVEKSLTQYLYSQLEYFLKAKNWQAASQQTDRLILNIAKREKQRNLDDNSINTFSCRDLKNIDQLWANADKRFGLSVQKEIWISTGNRMGIKPKEWNIKDNENYLNFAKKVGWYDGKT